LVREERLTAVNDWLVAWLALVYLEARKEPAMIELTDEQIRLLNTPDSAPPRVRNPQTNETFVLLRLEEYERLLGEDYDDSPWTREELEALAWEVGERSDWEEMGEYDPRTEKS
jgi:hypothetical protein